MVKRYQTRIPNLPGMVKTAEAAEQLDLAICTLFRQIHSGRLPFTLVGGHFYIAQATIDAVLAGRKMLEDLLQARQCLDSAVAATREPDRRRKSASTTPQQDA